MRRPFAASLALIPMLVSAALAEETGRADAACDAPVYMVVQGENNDMDKYREYGKALMDSRLYPKTGGYYVAQMRPVEMFEGEWGEADFQVIVRFPCHQAARDFWMSDTYKEIKKLRKGAGEVIVGIFPEVPVADWATWAMEGDAPE